MLFAENGNIHTKLDPFESVFSIYSIIVCHSVALDTTTCASLQIYLYIYIRYI